MKLSSYFPADYVLSVKPTAPQLEYFIKKEGLEVPYYWRALSVEVIRRHYKEPIKKAFGFASNIVKERLQELNVNIKRERFQPPYVLYHIQIDNPKILQQLTSLPEVRSVTQSDVLFVPEDEPQIPKEIEKSLEEWDPHGVRSSFQLSIRASNYIEKKKEESGNITYIYSDKHIKQRNKKKVKRILQLAKSIRKLRTQVKKDLKDKPVALVVALIDETFERVGNPASAEDDHFGVTTWRKKHISFSRGKAKIKYKGKSGVDQEKTISNSTLVKALKEQVKDKKSNDEVFPEVSAKIVNRYLKPFKITAKDIRGFHANDEMKKALKTVTSKEESIEKRRKEKFKKALEETAKLLGHNPSTLKNQYLAPSLEEDFLSSGKITIKAFVLSKAQLQPRETVPTSKTIKPIETKPIQEIPTNENQIYSDDLREYVPEELVKEHNWSVVYYTPDSVFLEYVQPDLKPAKFILTKSNEDFYLFFSPAVYRKHEKVNKIGPNKQELLFPPEEQTISLFFRLKPFLAITNTEYLFTTSEITEFGDI